MPQCTRRLAATCLLLSIALPVAALDILANGVFYRSYSDDDLLALSYPFPGGASVGLDELCPLFAEAWNLQAMGDSWASTRAWTDPGLAESLSSFSFVHGAGGWELSYGSERFGSPRRIDIRGELLEERELEVWLSWEGVAELKTEIERFAKARDLVVKAVELPDIQSKLLVQLRSGRRPPDLVMVQSDQVPELARAGAIQAIGYLAALAGSSSPKALEAFALEGRLWASPFYCDTQVVFYNPALASVPGVEWSLADLDDACRRAKAAGVREPLAFNAYSAYWLASFMAGFGKPAILEPDGSVRVDDGPMARALDYVLARRDEGTLSIVERDAMIASFVDGDAAFILSGSYSVPEFSAAGVSFGIAPYPRIAPGGERLRPFLDFKGFAVTKGTRSPLLARALARHLSSPSVQARFCIALSKIPSSDKARGPVLAGLPWGPALSLSFDEGLPVPSSRAYSVFKNTLWKILRLVYSGEMGIEEALSSAQRIIDANMAE